METSGAKASSLRPLLLGHSRTGFDLGISTRFRHIVALVLDCASPTLVRCVAGVVITGGVGARVRARCAAVGSLGTVLWNHRRCGHVGEVRRGSVRVAHHAALKTRVVTKVWRAVHAIRLHRKVEM
jgi:hypothetical protein